jgi:hypothetical protein
MLTDANATRNSVLNQIAVLKKKVNRNDEVVFYFAGHSAKYTDKIVPSFSRIGSKVGIVVWSDDPNATEPAVIWDSELKTAFNSFRTDRIVFGFDCCYAGGFSDLAGLGRIVVMASDGQDGISGEWGPIYAEAYGLEDIPGLEFCANGLFTYFFAVTGLSYGYSDINGDYIVTVEEAFSFAKAMLTDFTQQAQLMGLPFDEIPEMIDLFRGDLDL